MVGQKDFGQEMYVSQRSTECGTEGGSGLRCRVNWLAIMRGVSVESFAATSVAFDVRSE